MWAKDISKRSGFAIEQSSIALQQLQWSRILITPAISNNYHKNEGNVNAYQRKYEYRPELDLCRL